MYNKPNVCYSKILILLLMYLEKLQQVLQYYLNQVGLYNLGNENSYKHEVELTGEVKAKFHDMVGFPAELIYKKGLKLEDDKILVTITL